MCAKIAKHHTIGVSRTWLDLHFNPLLLATAPCDVFEYLRRMGAVKGAVLEARRDLAQSLLQLRLTHFSCTSHTFQKWR